MKPIEVFVRITPHDKGREDTKNRPGWFSKENCFNNILKTINPDLANITYFFDGDVNNYKDHFLNKNKQIKVLNCLQGGSDAATFYHLMKYINTLSLNDATIIYMLEDDYLHRPNWCEILQDGINRHSNSYVTLYDHPDKYWKFIYPDLNTKLNCGQYCYWRTIPSTTSTFALRFKTFREDLNESLTFCDLNNKSNYDHKRFTYLTEQKSRPVFSCMPGWATHCMSEYLAPFIDWSKYAFKA